MKKILLIITLLLSVNAFSQLQKVSDFRVYSGDATSLFVSDTIQGGLFVPYTGTDLPDSAMVFLDAKSRKWQRYTTDDKIMLRWYGIVPRLNFNVDDAPIINKALRYIKSHNNKFTTLKLDPTSSLTDWYFLKSTVELIGVTLEGTGQEKYPRSLFMVDKATVGFETPITTSGVDKTVNVTDVMVRTVDPLPGATDSNYHTFKIHVAVNFQNVYILNNHNGNGIHIDACGALPFTGNADQSNFRMVQAEDCINGLYVTGCDANVILFENCSFAINKRWGSYDNNFLGNRYINCHWASNGQQPNVGAGYNGVPYFLKEDIGDDIIGKRPDLYPQYWYAASEFIGGMKEWDATKKYYSGGTAWAANPNANNLFIGGYTENFQASAQLGLRSVWYEGLNGSPVRGGSYETTFFARKNFYGEGGIYANSIETKEIKSDVFKGNGSQLKNISELKVRESQYPPVAGDLNEGTSSIWKNTTNNKTYLYYNNGGVLIAMPIGGTQSTVSTGGVSQSDFDALQNAFTALQTKVNSLDAIIATKASKDEVRVVAEAVAALTVRVNNLPTGNQPNAQLTQILTELQSIINRLNNINN